MKTGVRNLVKGVFIMAVLCLMNGCILLPGPYETVDVEVIGARADASGKVYEQILHYNKRLNFVAVGLTPEGLVVPSYFGYSRYAAVTADDKWSIWSLEHFPSLAWTQVKWATPIPNSDRWIVDVENACSKDELALHLVVFSVREGKIVSQRFKHVKRYGPKGAMTVGSGYIEGNADLSWLRVHETDKITRVNTATGEMVVETAEMPAFQAAALNWQQLEKNLEQPPLRK